MNRTIISVSQISGWRAGYEDTDASKYAGFVPIVLLAVVDQSVDEASPKERVVLPMILDGLQLIFADQRPGYRLTKITTPDQSRIA